jgi:amino acid transporter
MGLFPTEFYYFLVSGAVLMGIVVFIMNFLLGGFLGPFLKVKASRGRKVLVRVHHPIQDFFRVGEIVEGFLVYVDRAKETRRLKMQPGIVTRSLNVYWVEVDDEKNCFFKRESGDAVSGFDAVKFDELLKRALYRPLTLGDQLLKIALILLAIVVLGIIIIGFFSYKNYKGVQELLAILKVTTEAAANTGVVP